MATIQAPPKATARRRRRFTADEYHRMAEAGILGEDERVELLDGDVVEMSPVGDRHVAAVNRCTRRFTLALGERAWVSPQNPVRSTATTSRNRTSPCAAGGGGRPTAGGDSAGHRGRGHVGGRRPRGQGAAVRPGGRPGDVAAQRGGQGAGGLPRAGAGRLRPHRHAAAGAAGGVRGLPGRRAAGGRPAPARRAWSGTRSGSSPGSGPPAAAGGGARSRRAEPRPGPGAVRPRVGLGPECSRGPAPTSEGARHRCAPAGAQRPRRRLLLRDPPASSRSCPIWCGDGPRSGSERHDSRTAEDAIRRRGRRTAEVGPARPGPRRRGGQLSGATGGAPASGSTATGAPVWARTASTPCGPAGRSGQPRPARRRESEVPEGEVGDGPARAALERQAGQQVVGAADRGGGRDGPRGDIDQRQPAARVGGRAGPGDRRRRWPVDHHRVAPAVPGEAPLAGGPGQRDGVRRPAGARPPDVGEGAGGRRRAGERQEAAVGPGGELPRQRAGGQGRSERPAGAGVELRHGAFHAGGDVEHRRRPGDPALADRHGLVLGSWRDGQ